MFLLSRLLGASMSTFPSKLPYQHFPFPVNIPLRCPPPFPRTFQTHICLFTMSPLPPPPFFPTHACILLLSSVPQLLSLLPRPSPPALLAHVSQPQLFIPPSDVSVHQSRAVQFTLGLPSQLPFDFWPWTPCTEGSLATPFPPLQVQSVAKPLYTLTCLRLCPLLTWTRARSLQGPVDPPRPWTPERPKAGPLHPPRP